MINLREIAAKKLAEQALDACEVEYKQLWHNDSLRGNWPDWETDAEHDAFWECLGDAVSCLIKDLQDEIQEQTGLTMRLYTWGRGGATIAPDGFSDSHHHFNNYLNRDLVIDWWDYEKLESTYYLDESEDAATEWAEAYKAVQSHLAAFKLINERVRAEAGQDLAAWWTEEKAARELSFTDDDDLLEEAAG